MGIPQSFGIAQWSKVIRGNSLIIASHIDAVTVRMLIGRMRPGLNKDVSIDSVQVEGMYFLFTKNYSDATDRLMFQQANMQPCFLE